MVVAINDGDCKNGCRRSVSTINRSHRNGDDVSLKRCVSVQALREKKMTGAIDSKSCAFLRDFERNAAIIPSVFIGGRIQPQHVPYLSILEDLHPRWCVGEDWRVVIFVQHSDKQPGACKLVQVIRYPNGQVVLGDAIGAITLKLPGDGHNTSLAVKRKVARAVTFKVVGQHPKVAVPGVFAYVKDRRANIGALADVNTKRPFGELWGVVVDIGHRDGNKKPGTKAAAFQRLRWAGQVRALVRMPPMTPVEALAHVVSSRTSWRRGGQNSRDNLACEALRRGGGRRDDTGSRGRDGKGRHNRAVRSKAAGV